VAATTPVVCPGGLRPKAYLLGYGPTLFDFDPQTLETHALGTLTLPSSNAEPARMTVSQTGTAYAFFLDANLYRIDLASLAPTATAYVPKQLGFVEQAYGQQPWITLTPSDDRLYMVGNPTTPTLAISDLAGFQLNRIGAIQPDFYAQALADVKADASGRLFALTYDGALLDIDATTGAIVAEDNTGFLPPGVNTCYMPWASPYELCGIPMLLPYDGALYLIGGSENSVARYDLTAKTLEPVGQVATDIWAVSAMTCVHAPSDGGADDAADAADAAAPASDAGSE
jgi:hypothetical protein